MPKCFSFVVAALSCASAVAFAPRPFAARGESAPSRRFSTTIDKPVTTPRTTGGDPKNKEKSGGGKGKHELLLFDDPVNTREYVSRVLCTKVALTEGEAYDCMMQARAGVPLRGSLGGVSSRSYSLSDDPSSPEPPATRLPERARAERSSLKRRRPQAHQMGMAVVGVYQFEVAENYCSQMKESGLVAAVKPVGDGGGDDK